MCRTQNYQNNWVAEGEAGYPVDTTVPKLVQDVYGKKDTGDTTYDDLKKMCDGMLCDTDPRWPLATVMVRERCASLRLLVPVRI